MKHLVLYLTHRKHRTLWYLRSASKVKPKTLTKCRELKIELVTDKEVDQRAIAQPLTKFEALKLARTLGFSVLTYQDIDRQYRNHSNGRTKVTGAAGI